MGYVNARIVNCKKASIRRHPWITPHSEDIVGVRDGPSGTERGEIKEGSTIRIDPNEVCYDWTGRRFFKVQNPQGWIYEGAVDIGG